MRGDSDPAHAAVALRVFKDAALIRAEAGGLLGWRHAMCPWASIDSRIVMEARSFQAICVLETRFWVGSALVARASLSSALPRWPDAHARPKVGMHKTFRVR